MYLLHHFRYFKKVTNTEELQVAAQTIANGYIWNECIYSQEKILWKTYRCNETWIKIAIFC